MTYHDDDDEEGFEPERDLAEDPDTDDADWNLEPDLIQCPHCRREISEDAQWCPHCDHYLSEEDAPAVRKPIWIWIGVGMCVVIMIVLILR